MAFISMGRIKMLFEESGILLDHDEQIIIKGAFKGKVPVGPSPYAVNAAIWEKMDGELVITNRRTFALNRRGMVRKKIECCELRLVGASVKKSLLGKETLQLSLNYGDPKAVIANVEVDNPTEWIKAIKGI